MVLEAFFPKTSTLTCLTKLTETARLASVESVSFSLRFLRDEVCSDREPFRERLPGREVSLVSGIGVPARVLDEDHEEGFWFRVDVKKEARSVPMMSSNDVFDPESFTWNGIESVKANVRTDGMKNYIHSNHSSVQSRLVRWERHTWQYTPLVGSGSTQVLLSLLFMYDQSWCHSSRWSVKDAITVSPALRRGRGRRGDSRGRYLN
jgi:hypothetical protein